MRKLSIWGKYFKEKQIWWNLASIFAAVLGKRSHWAAGNKQLLQTIFQSAFFKAATKGQVVGKCCGKDFLFEVLSWAGLLRFTLTAAVPIRRLASDFSRANIVLASWHRVEVQVLRWSDGRRDLRRHQEHEGGDRYKNTGLLSCPGASWDQGQCKQPDRLDGSVGDMWTLPIFTFIYWIWLHHQ